ncbi:MAG: purine-nucleoside phosphorylase [Euzebyales bacterium]|nr:purine-nucleoside phosphorylase [Euzebyales bacterium]
MTGAGGLTEMLEGFRPRVLLTLGSGLGALAEEVADPLVLDFAALGLPGPTVPGHAGRLVAGDLRGVPVLVQQGRVHLYEGVPARDVAACVREAAAAGVESFVVTNAAGGLSPDLQPGDLLAISDHLNLTGTNPLLGVGGVPQFVDLSGAYDPHLRLLAHDAAAAVGEPLTEGVYAGLTGPAYETPAEVTMLRTLGADVVGMSTVSEVIQARALGLRVVGFSLVTNVHRPGGPPTDHGEVLAAAAAGGPRLAAVLRALLDRL